MHACRKPGGESHTAISPRRVELQSESRQVSNQPHLQLTGAGGQPLRSERSSLRGRASSPFEI